MISKILASMLVAVLVVGGLYYKITSAQLEEMRNLNAALTLADQEQKQTIQALQDNIKLQTEALLTQQKQSQEIQQEMNRYLDIFKRHDLSKLARAKPGLIEPRVNKATKEVFDALESDSAALTSSSN
jgi:predicted PurR-regulated permease PerM